MKKSITIAIMFFSLMSFAQIKVLETVPVVKLGYLKSNFYIQKVGDEVTVYYNSIQNDDDKSSAMKKFSFRDLDNAYNSLYSIIQNGFAGSPLNDIKLELPNHFVWLHYNNANPNKLTVQFMVSNKEGEAANVSEPLTINDVAKLFQKA